jgi:multimeric flavodoxin WrbA
MAAKVDEYNYRQTRHSMDEKMIIAVNASTHKDGSGETILNAVMDGASENGKEVRIYNLNELGPLRECQNCGSCRRTGRCVLADPIAEIMDEVRDCEGLIQSTPISFNVENGLYRMFQNRFFSFMDMNFSTTIPKGKKLVTIVTCGLDIDSAEKVSLRLEKTIEQHFFFEPVGRIVFNTFFNHDAAKDDEELLEKARSLGRIF